MSRGGDGAGADDDLQGDDDLWREGDDGDGLLGDDDADDAQMVGSFDADAGLVTLRMWAPGPAGESAISLGDGTLELAVDHADPEVITGLTIDPRSARSLAVADVLLDGRARSVVEAAEGRARVLWRPSAGRDDDPRRAERREAARRQRMGRLGQAAVLAAEVERLDVGELARALGMIELANLVDDVAVGLGVAPGAPALWRAGATRLVDLDPSWTDELDLVAARDVDTVLMRARKGLLQLDGGLSRAVDAVRARLAPHTGRPGGAGGRPGARPDGGWHPSAGSMREGRGAADELQDALFEMPPADISLAAMRPAPAAPAPVPALSAKVQGARDQATEAVVPVAVVPPVQGTVVASQHRGDAVEVTVRGEIDLDSTWLRVFRLTEGVRMRPVLVAMAPFRREGYGRARAVALVPAEMGAEPLSADVTVAPEGPWRAPSLTQVAAAIDAGRRACRAERRGDRPEAWELWQVCAERWAETGDPAREMQARNLSAGHPARGGRTTRRRGARQSPRPFALDHLD